MINLNRELNIVLMIFVFLIDSAMADCSSFCYKDNDPRRLDRCLSSMAPSNYHNDLIKEFQSHTVSYLRTYSEQKERGDHLVEIPGSAMVPIEAAECFFDEAGFSVKQIQTRSTPDPEVAESHTAEEFSKGTSGNLSKHLDCLGKFRRQGLFWGPINRCNVDITVTFCGKGTLNCDCKNFPPSQGECRDNVRPGKVLPILKTQGNHPVKIWSVACNKEPSGMAYWRDGEAGCSYSR